MDNENATPCAAVTTRIPPFWPADPQAWFLLIESQFALRNITNSKTKFHHVVSGLTPEMVTKLMDVISNTASTTPYEDLRTAITTRLGDHDHEQIHRLLQPHHGATPQRPSSTLVEVQRILGGVHADKDTVKKFFLHKLPPITRAIIAASQESDLNELAKLADTIFNTSVDHPHVATIHDQHADLLALVGSLTKQVAELQLQHPATREAPTKQADNFKTNQQRWRRRSLSPKAPQAICWYHQRFGKEARRCTPPCRYSQTAEN